MRARSHILEQPQAGRRDQSVLEFFRGLEQQRREVLALPRDMPGEVVMDILEAIRRAYQNGRDDRTAEFIPTGRPADDLRSAVHAEALDAIASWGPGYIDQGDADCQYYLGLEGRDEANGTLTVTISRGHHGEVLGRYRLLLLAEEVTP